jgi:hypothetical protein
MRFVGVKRPEQQSVMVLHGHTEAHPALERFAATWQGSALSPKLDVTG